MRYTVEMFQPHNLPKYHSGHILTRDEVRQLDKKSQAEKSEVVMDGSRPGVRLFTTNHSFGYTVLPENFVSCTTSFPCRIVPRPGFEKSYLDTPKDLMDFHEHCDPNVVVIESIEELVEYLNKYYG